VTLLSLWLTVTFRGRSRQLFITLGLLLLGYLLITLVPLYLREARAAVFWEFREQVVLYARHAAVLWGGLLVAAAVIVWDARRRYLRLA
jgi:hypothetical protein